MSGRPGSFEVRQDGTIVSRDVHTIDFQSQPVSAGSPDPGVVFVGSGAGVASLGADGAYHLFVNAASGSDGNDGLTSGTPIQSLGEANFRANLWGQAGLDATLVIELACGTYPAINFVLNFQPLQRVFMRGPQTTMTVIASGVATGGASDRVTDASAAFGDLRGLILRVFLAGMESTTEQFATVTRFNATNLFPESAFFPVPAAGWTYQVLRPCAIIDCTNADFEVALPWNRNFTESSFGQIDDGPLFMMAWIQIQRTVGTGAIFRPKGGSIQLLGVIVDSNARAVESLSTCLNCGNYAPVRGDPVLGLGAGDFRFHASLGIFSGAGTTNGLVDFGSAIFGAPVIRGDFNGDRTQGNWFGGTIIDGRMLLEPGHMELFDGFDPLLPVFMQGAGNGAGLMNVREGSVLLLNAIAWRAIGGDAILVQRGGSVFILGVPFLQTVAADIPGNCVQCDTGGHCQVTTAVTDVNFISVLNRVQVDANVAINWAGVFPEVGAATAESKVWRA